MAFPFPPQYANLLISDPKLDVELALDLAVAQKSHPKATLSRVAISVVDPDPKKSGLYRHAGIRADKVYFGASLLKVAAMYAAFELRNTCRAVARASKAATRAALFAEMAKLCNAKIKAAVPALATAGLPKYSTIFAAAAPAAGGWQLLFSTAFAASMRKMIVESSNNDAAICIQALGYGWINGALRAAGFFRAPTKATGNGIWLAGSFSKKFPSFSTPTADGGGSAQAMTCIDMTNLYAHLLNRSLVDGPSSDGMLLLLEKAQAYESSWLSPGRVKTRSFTPTHTKIGVAPRKGENVYSEATVITQGGEKAIVVFLNALGDSHDAISEIVDLYL